MPPPDVHSIKDLIFWQFAKILADNAGLTKSHYPAVKERFFKLKSGEIAWPDSVREFIRKSEDPARCIYCGRKTILKNDRLLSLSRSGSYNGDNTIRVCLSCSSSKGEKRLYEWYGIDHRDTIPKVAESKYLNLIYALHYKRGTLNESSMKALCGSCDMYSLCPEKATLSVYCLEGCFIKK